MTQIIAYLNFRNNTREAMNFYKDCFGGELNIMTVAESPMASQMPADAQNSVLHSKLTNGSLSLMGSDMIMGDKLTMGNSMTLVVNSSNEDEIKTYFTKLSAGGKVKMPLQTAFWGGLYGELTDKYGIQWALNGEKQQ